MSDQANLRKELRPPGVVSASCPGCVFFDQCGGIQNSRPLMNCFDQFCCGDGSCDNICPYKPDFAERLREVNGLRFDDIPLLKQDELSLPFYVPLVHHHYRRSKSLSVRCASLELYDLFRLRSGSYQTVVDSADALRAHFRLATDTEIILRGTAEDEALERYWSYRKTDDVAKQIARLGVSLVIGPNFSTFLDVPRTDALFNRKRQLMCLTELSEAGVSVAPHLSATMPADWRFWADFLRDNPSLRHIALNCQTGYKNPKEGRKAITRIASIQQELGRELALILIGGGQFMKFVSSERFKTVTLIDSEPFAKTMRRRRMAASNGKREWEETWTLERQPLDHLLSDNIGLYSDWVQRQSDGRQTVLR
jgi:hypothetical protein